jgi:hypothetical protein
MTLQRIRIYLHDEAPRIGAGFRICQAIIGRKWVRLAAVRAKNKIARGKLSLEQYEQLSVTVLPPRKRRRKA